MTKTKNNTIWKSKLKPGETHLVMPDGAVILSAQYQKSQGAMMLWYMVNPEKVTVGRKFFAIGTGHDIPDDIVFVEFIDTVQIGELVFHVFEIA